jgi:hypothetical protein
MKRGGLALESRASRGRPTLTTQMKPLLTHGGFTSLLWGYT